MTPDNGAHNIDVGGLAAMGQAQRSSSTHCYDDEDKGGISETDPTNEQSDMEAMNNLAANTHFGFHPKSGIAFGWWFAAAFVGAVLWLSMLSAFDLI